MKELNQKLAYIQTKLKAKKSSYNSFGKYYFRKAEDILEAVKPFLLENSVSVTVTEDIVGTTEIPIIKSTAIISDGENSITATAVVGVDLNQKGMQTSQKFGAASTYGKKYALGNLFLIDDTEDADAMNNHGKAAQLTQNMGFDKPSMDDTQFQKAIEFMKKGGALAAIDLKYKINDSQREVLKQNSVLNG